MPARKHQHTMLLAGTTPVPDWRRKPERPRSSWLRDVLKDVHLTAQVETWTAWRTQRGPLPTTRSNDNDDDESNDDDE